MSNNKFHFELKKRTPKIYDFFSFMFIFLFLKIYHFYSFFIRIKVKHLNIKNKENKKLRELLKFSFFSPYVHLIFSYL